MKLLLAWADVDVNSNGAEFIPLALAAGNGQESVVKLLLARDDIDMNVTNAYQQMALTLAAKGGHEGIVWLLLAWDDININLLDFCLCHGQLNTGTKWWSSCC